MPRRLLLFVQRGSGSILSDDEAMLAVVRTGQHQFEKVTRDYLTRIFYGSDGWAARLRLPAYATAEVVVDPGQAFG